MKIARILCATLAAWSLGEGYLMARSLPPLVQWSADSATMLVIVGNRLQLFDASGKPGKALTLDAEPAEPAFSPDGTKLAFIVKGQMWILDIASESKVQVFDSSSPMQFCRSPQWSSNGQILTFLVITAGNPGEGQIYMARADGTNKALLVRYAP